MPQRQNYNLDPTLPQRWIASLTHVLWKVVLATLLHTEIATSNSQHLYNKDIKRQINNFVPKSPQHWIVNSPHSTSWML